MIRPLLGMGKEWVAEPLRPLDADRAEDRAEHVAATTGPRPRRRFEDGRGHLAGIDDADFRDKQRAAQTGDDRGDDEDEEFEIGGGIMENKTRFSESRMAR